MNFYYMYTTCDTITRQYKSSQPKSWWLKINSFHRDIFPLFVREFKEKYLEFFLYNDIVGMLYIQFMNYPYYSITIIN